MQKLGHFIGRLTATRQCLYVAADTIFRAFEAVVQCECNVTNTIRKTWSIEAIEQWTGEDDRENHASAFTPIPVKKNTCAYKEEHLCLQRNYNVNLEVVLPNCYTGQRNQLDEFTFTKQYGANKMKLCIDCGQETKKRLSCKSIAFKNNRIRKKSFRGVCSSIAAHTRYIILYVEAYFLILGSE